MSIKIKLFLIFVVTALLPFMTIGLFIYFDFQQTLKDTLVQKLEAVATLQQSRVNSALDNYFHQLDLISSRTALRSTLSDYKNKPSNKGEESIKKIIKDIEVAIPEIKAISIFDVGGNLITSSNIDFITENKLVSVDKNIEINSSNNLSMFKDSQNIVFVNFTVPIFYNSQIVGFIGLVRTNDALVSVTEDHTGLGKTGETVLVSKDGDNARVLTPLRFNGSSSLSKIIYADKPYPEIQAVKGVENLFTEGVVDYRNQEVVAATRFIEGVNWGLVVKIDKTEAFSSLDSLRNQLLFSGIFIVLILLLLIQFLAQIITAPILSLIRNAQKVQQGDFSVRNKISSKDEIGTLASALNVMTENLEDFYHNLEDKVRARNKEIEAKNKNLEDTRRALINLLEDLSQNKKNIERSQTETLALIQSIGEGVVSMDEYARIVNMNASAEEMLGYKKEELLGKWIISSIPVWDESGTPIPADETALTDALVTGEKQKAIYQLERKDKTRFIAGVIVAPIMVDKEPRGASLVFRDITQEREIDRTKTEFVSVASHQLRTPLSTIGWYVEMLLAGDLGTLGEEQRKYLQQIYHSNKRMVDLVNSLLNVSRLEVGAFIVVPTPVNLKSMATDVLGELKGQIFTKNLTVNESYGKDVPDLMLDPSLTRIILQNLLSNAVKYTPEHGKILVSIDMEEANDRDPEKHVLIKISDTGCGIPREQQSKIFTKMYRADNARERDPEGTGLGLYIIKSILAQTGGNVWFESVVNQGTTFFISLPIVGMKRKEGTKKLV